MDFYGIYSADKTELFLGAADDLLEFERFAEQPPEIEGVVLHRLDIIELFTSETVSKLKIAPLRVSGDIEAFLDQHGVEVFNIDNLLMRQDIMMEVAEEKNRAATPDRRTHNEIYDIDPDLRSDFAVTTATSPETPTDATSNSFGSVTKDGITIHDGRVEIKEDGSMSAEISASKSVTALWTITASGVDWEALLNEFRIPENRVILTDDQGGMIMLHPFQIEQIDRYLTDKGISATFESDQASRQKSNEITVHLFDGVELLFAAKIEGVDSDYLGKTYPHLDPLVFELHTVGDDCLIVTPVRKDLEDACEKITEGSVIYAVNRKGEKLVDESSGVRVVDTNAETIIGPRPWNEHAAKFETMTPWEITDIANSVDASEYVFVCEFSEVHRKTIVYIAPETYFDKNDEFFTGKLLVMEKFSGVKFMGVPLFTPTELPYAFEAVSSTRLVRDTLLSAGFRESIWLQAKVNSLRNSF